MPIRCTAIMMQLDFYREMRESTGTLFNQLLKGNRASYLYKRNNCSALTN